MAFRLNRTRVTSRDEYSTNQKALVCDVTYLIYVTKCGRRNHCLFREATLTASRKDPKRFTNFYFCDRKQKSQPKWWVLLRKGSKKLTYSNKCHVILPFITKFVACWERGECKRFRHVGRRFCCPAKLHEIYITVQMCVFFVIILVDILVAQR